MCALSLYHNSCKMDTGEIVRFHRMNDTQNVKCKCVFLKTTYKKAIIHSWLNPRNLSETKYTKIK